MFRNSALLFNTKKTAGGHVLRRGFTLAEVLVTLAIIAVMAAVLLPALNQQLSKGDTGRLASDLTSLQTAAQAFLSDVHRYPATVAQLTATPTGNDLLAVALPQTLINRWKGPYLTRDVLATTGGGGSISASFASVSSNLAVVVTNVTATDWANLESVFDEGTTGTTSSTGVVRMSGTASIVFLALPIQ